MNNMRCPRCGYMNKPNSTYCQHCGAQLNQRPMMMNQFPPRQRHHGFLTSLNIILISLVVAGGVFFYENSRPLNSVATTTEKASINYQPIKIYWQNVNNKVNSGSSNGGSTNVDYLFKNGANNYDLKGMKDWLRIDIKPSLKHGTTVTSMKPYDFKTKDGKIMYKVRYNFDTNDTHHIEVFNWNANVQNNKIISMKSDKKPARSYDE